MAAEEYSEIFNWHPELILISECPVTWEGLLIISWMSNAETRIKIKLIVPKYPLLTNAKLFFGRKLSFLYGTKFNADVYNLLQSAVTVSSFLRQLQMLIGNSVHDNLNTYIGTVDYTEEGILEELKTVLQTPCDVQVSSNSNLNVIKLSLKDVAIVLRRSENCETPWKVISSDLPELPRFESFNKSIFSLNDAANKFKSQVEILESAWSRLSEIDKNCWIIDPLQPKPHHLHRRIYLTQSLSVLINIDPFNSADLPDIKLLGSDTEVAKYRNIMSENLQEWDSECNLLDNLMTLLNVHEFPQASVAQSSTENDGIVAEEECCICFTLELDTGQFPEKTCNNPKCRRQFHTMCLLQWLQAIAGNQIVFGHIHGTCPHCGESMSCPVTSH